jgi:holin-like protein
MKSSPASVERRWFHRPILTFWQTLFFVGVWMGADLCVRKAGVKVPGSVLGLGLVVTLLFTGILKARHVQLGAEFLLAEMMLFFMPAFVVAITYLGLFATEGLRLVAAVALGTLVVMAGTVWVVDRVFRWESRRSGTVAADE